MDAVTQRSRDSWVEAYRALGADRTRDELGGTEKNRNEQFRRERRKYDDCDADLDEESDFGGAVEEVLFVDAKRGQGTHAISRAVYRAGRHVNERRRRRGLNDRPLRVGIIGFPNVGKVSHFLDTMFCN
jgi:ribosome biogenesis GTPase A